MALAAASGARPARAQELALKRSAVRPQATACPVIPLPRQPAAQQQNDARQRAAVAQEAAIVGNQRAAREQFARAAQLDPSNEEIAYQYGRALEDAGSRAEALREYCRYITLAPASGDAADVRARIAALAPPAPTRGVDLATPQFRAGLTSFDGGRYEDAERSFTRAIDEAPTWADAHYNRALARLAQREPAGAVTDLRRYLELRPDAPDRVTVLTQVAGIERPLPFTPGGALGRGVVIPGWGQFHTRRPLLGAVVLAAVGGSVAYALQSQQELRQDSVEVPLVDGRVVLQPAGDPYSVTVRPNAAAGVAIAAGVTATAAIESYVYARRARSQALSGRVRRTAALRLRPLPARDRRSVGMALDLTLPVVLGAGR